MSKMLFTAALLLGVSAHAESVCTLSATVEANVGQGLLTCVNDEAAVPALPVTVLIAGDADAGKLVNFTAVTKGGTVVVNPASLLGEYAKSENGWTSVFNNTLTLKNDLAAPAFAILPPQEPGTGIGPQTADLNEEKTGPSTVQYYGYGGGYDEGFDGYGGGWNGGSDCCVSSSIYYNPGICNQFYGGGGVVVVRPRFAYPGFYGGGGWRGGGFYGGYRGYGGFRGGYGGGWGRRW